MTDAWDYFKGEARPLSDSDIPRVGHKIGVGEDELHALIDVESAGKGFDSHGRLKMLFEPHVFYRNLSGAELAAAVKAGLAYKKWGEKPYPKDSYGRLLAAIKINERAALMSASWGLGQILGENYKVVGYHSVTEMVRSFTESEASHLEAMVQFIVSNGIDDDMRALAALKRATTPEDCVAIVRVYNGSGYAKHSYHVKFAAAHNKWRKIKDTPWSPESDTVTERLQETVEKPSRAVVEQVQDILWDKGYPEVGESDGAFGTKTRAAILAFQADNKIPLSGIITDDLLSQLIKAPVRTIYSDRKDATAKGLRSEPIVHDGEIIKKIGGALVAVAGLGTLLNGAGSIEDMIAGAKLIKTFGEEVSTMGPWAIALMGGVVVYMFGRRIVLKYVEGYQKGQNL